MPLFQYAVLKKYLLGIDEKNVKHFPAEAAEWLDYFTQQKAKAEELKSQIAQTDAEIDKMVYELTEEEVRVVEGAGN